jgi:hypothetical protein
VCQIQLVVRHAGGIHEFIFSVIILHALWKLSVGRLSSRNAFASRGAEVRMVRPESSSSSTYTHPAVSAGVIVVGGLGPVKLGVGARIICGMVRPWYRWFCGRWCVPLTEDGVR